MTTPEKNVPLGPGFLSESLCVKLGVPGKISARITVEYFNGLVPEWIIDDTLEKATQYLAESFAEYLNESEETKS